MHIAFAGSASTKRDLMDRLERSLQHASDAYPDFVEAATGSPDREAYSAITGLPPSLVALIDQALLWIWHSSLTGKSDAISFALRALDTEPGVALDAVPVRLLIWMLNDVERYCISAQGGDALGQLLRELVALHQRRLAGEPLDKKEWRLFRARAIATTDEINDHVLRRASRVIEAGAWDVPTSRVVLTDILAAYRELRILVAGERSGWSVDDERRATAILQGIHDETQPQRDAGELVAIPPIFRAREPEIAAGYEANLKAQNVAAGVAMKDVIGQVIIFLEEASNLRDKAIPA